MLQTLEVSLPELLERVRTGQIPMSAQARVTYDDGALDDEAFHNRAPGDKASVAASHGIDKSEGGQESRTDQHESVLELLAQWEKEDAQMTPEQQADSERVYAHIEREGIPRTRL